MAPRSIVPPPYKNYLQAALHRRFISSAALVLAICYAEAVFTADWSSCPTGLYTFFLFSSAFWVLILRISQYRVSIRTANSPIHAIALHGLKIQTAEVLLSYGLSAFLFYWTRTQPAFPFIQYVHGDRARLNEKPLFLACYLFTCALIQSLHHFWVDQDRLQLGTTIVEGKIIRITASAKPGAEQTEQIQNRVLRTTTTSLTKVILSTLTSILLYFLFFRRFLWSWTLSVIRPFYNLPKTNMLPLSLPLTFPVLLECFWSGMFLFSLWGMANASFTFFMSKPPLKNGQPLTAESKDPNGSLLNGLKNKRSATRSFAMWELAYIAESNGERRKAIYEDIDRKDGSVWSQIFEICTHAMQPITQRMEAIHYKRPEPPRVDQHGSETTLGLEETPIQQNTSSHRSRSSAVEKAFANAFNASGQQTPLQRMSPVAKRAVKGATDRVLSKEQQETLKPRNISSFVQHYGLVLLQYDFLGQFFRQDYRNRLAVALLGTPYADLALYTNAVTALTELAVHSIAEDRYGNVQRDIAALCRLFHTHITQIQHTRNTFPAHWSEINQPGRDSSSSSASPETDLMLQTLTTGLSRVLQVFEPYASDVGLSGTTLRQLKAAAADGAK